MWYRDLLNAIIISENNNVLRFKGEKGLQDLDLKDIDRNILSDLFTAVFKKKWDAEQAYEKGYDDGREKGFEDGRKEGYDDGYSEGREDGYNEGYDIGYDNGQLECGDID